MDTKLIPNSLQECFTAFGVPDAGSISLITPHESGSYEFYLLKGAPDISQKAVSFRRVYLVDKKGRDISDLDFFNEIKDRDMIKDFIAKGVPEEFFKRGGFNMIIFRDGMMIFK